MMSGLQSPLSDADFAELMPFGDAEPSLTGYQPSVLRPENLGLDPKFHRPVDLPKPRKRIGPVLYRMWTEKSANRQITAIGALQRDLAVHLVTNPDHVVVHERPHRLTYFEIHQDGSIDKREHVPAFGVRFRDGSVAFIDVRPDKESDPNWPRKAVLLAEAYARDHGVQYACLREAVVRVQPLLSNLGHIRRLADLKDRKAVIAVRSALASLGLPAAVGAVRAAALLPVGFEGSKQETQFDRGLSALMGLVLAGEVRLDLSRPIADDTMVLAPGAAR